VLVTYQDDSDPIGSQTHDL